MNVPVQPSLFDKPKGDCPMCNGDGVYTISGYSINPYNGCLAVDPQLADDVTCPNCGGTGSPTIPY